MRALFALSVLAGLFGCSPADTHDKAASSNNDALSNAATLSATCSGCHASGGSAITDLASLSRKEIEASLLRYKADTAGTTVMHRLARGYSKQDLRLIADYISSNNSGDDDD